jgi:hypothetical protein
MKVGDMVKQNTDNGLVQIKSSPAGDLKPGKQTLGTVIAIHDIAWPPGAWPKDEENPGRQMMWETKIGRRVDVLWTTGHISKNFAEHVLEVVVSTHTAGDKND